VQHLVGRHVGEDEANDLCRIEILRHLHGARLRHANAFGIRAPHRQRADAVPWVEPGAARTELLDDANELVARRKRWSWAAGDVRPRAQLGIGERHAGCQDAYAYLAPNWFRNVILHYLHDLGATIVINDHAFHVTLSSVFAGK
jgi:hypothetical protein